MIVIVYIAYLMSSVMCHEVNQYIDDGTNLNVTTLYPVQDFIHNNTKENNSSTNIEAETVISKHNEQTKDQLKQDYFHKENSKDITHLLRDENYADDKITEQDSAGRGADSKNDPSEKEKSNTPKLDSNNWKIETYFTAPKLSIQNYTDTKNLQNPGKEFKPSPLLGQVYGDDAFMVPTQATIESFSPVNKNPTSYFSSPGDFYKLNYKPPTYPDLKDIPYKFVKSISPREEDWKHSTGIEAKPTVGAPVKIPAGGLYKLPDPFKEKPSSDGDDDNFGLDFRDEEKDAKANPVKKRGNPWSSILHLITTLLPVGLILSALAPNIITLETVDTNHYYPNRFSRRSGAASSLPPINENCKRRLLCELHSDAHYGMQSPQRQKHCYKIQCDDPHALSKVLHWLLLYNRSRGYRPDVHDRRSYIT